MTNPLANNGLFSGGLEAEAVMFAARVPEGVVPPAAVQEFLIARSGNPERAVAEAHLLARASVHVVERAA